MTRKEAKVKRYAQRIDENFLLDLKQHPTQVPEWFTDNFIQRTFAYLCGTTETDTARMLRITGAGAVKIADIGSGLELVERIEGITTFPESGNINFTREQHKIRVISRDFPFWIRTSPDGFKWNHQIYISGNTTQDLDIVTRVFRVQSEKTFNHANYEVIGFR